MEAKIMTEAKERRLTKIYNVYNNFEWLMVVMIIVTIVLLNYFSYNFGFGLEELMAAFSDLPSWVLIPMFVIYTAYTLFSIVLYIKVWPIKSISRRFVYWFDWVLTFVIIGFELMMFVTILSQ